LNTDFNFDQFLASLESKVYFYLPKNSEKKSFHIVNIEPFGILKIAKQKSEVKKELEEKLSYFQSEYERA
jgi:hypothetical protein